MRNTFVGLTWASALACGVAFGQNAQPGQPQAQPARQPGQPAQPNVAQPSQPQPGQPRPGQTGQAVQPGAVRAPGQQDPGRAQLPQQGGQTSSADQQIAAKIHGGGHNEIEISKFAQSKLQSAEARAFAEKMVSDHTADAESYQRWAGKHGDAGARHEEPSNRTGQGGQGQAAAQQGGVDWNKVHEQVAKQCLESAKQELGRHQGGEFDQAFMGMQLAGHMHMQDELKVLRNHASPELQQQIDKSLQVVQGHLQQARQVMETLKDRPSERVSRRPEDKQK